MSAGSWTAGRMRGRIGAQQGVCVIGTYHRSERRRGPSIMGEAGTGLTNQFVRGAASLARLAGAVLLHGRLFDALVCDKHRIQFKAAQGAGDHCEGAARTLFHPQVFEWLATVLAASGGRSLRPRSRG